MRDSFSACHPIISFTYFALMIGLSVFLTQPVLLVLSFAGALCFYLLLKGLRALRFSLRFLLPLMIAVLLINLLFNHKGVTILGYFRGNPMTLESVIYGAAAGVTLGAALLWFCCCSVVMTSDKFIYLFGRLVPGLSLVFSMALRFILRFNEQLRIIAEAQKCVGRGVGGDSLAGRVRNGLNILSAMAAWALKNAADTSDSMRARGYGLPYRSSFSLFRFDARDRTLAIVLAAAAAPSLYAAAAGRFTAQYFPYIIMPAATGFGAVFYCAFAVLSFLPAALNLFASAVWRGAGGRAGR
jgi:energy-coupling factor transport system permease protein